MHYLVNLPTPSFIKQIYENDELISNNDSNGIRLIHQIIARADVEKYFILKGFGQDLHILDNEKKSLLHWACLHQNDTYIISDLVKAGLDPMDKDVNGLTAIHYCTTLAQAQYFHLWLSGQHIAQEELIHNELHLIDYHEAKDQKEIAQFWRNMF